MNRAQRRAEAKAQKKRQTEMRASMRRMQEAAAARKATMVPRQGGKTTIAREMNGARPLDGPVWLDEATEEASA